MTPNAHFINLRRPIIFALSVIIMALARPGLHSQASSLLGDTGNPRIRAGSVQEEIRVAGNYLIGRGVPIDPVQSAYWYRKAADQGNPEAQAELGYFYMAGIGVPRDESTAIKWFTRAAGSGSRLAKLNLAAIYMNGSGVNRDTILGINILNQLAQKGYPVAESYLGVAYYCGSGVPMNRSIAEKWFAKSAKAGDPEGEFAMGTLYSIDENHAHDLVKAAEFLERASKSGYVPAMHALGLLLVNHPEIAPQRMPGEATQLLESAAESGSWHSAAVLGILARDGRGTQQDSDAAYRWFTIAAKQGGDQAETYLRTDLTICRTTLAANQQQEDVHAAEAWLRQHPQRDLFILAHGQQTELFPIQEIYDIAQSKPN